MEKLNEETKRLMDERFGHDNVIALATQDGDMPDAAHRDCQGQPSVKGSAKIRHNCFRFSIAMPKTAKAAPDKTVTTMDKRYEDAAAAPLSKEGESASMSGENLLDFGSRLIM